MKKLYTDTRTLYINGDPVNYYCIGNLRYGEPVIEKTPVEDFKELCDIMNAPGCWQSPIKLFRGFKKIKINKKVYRIEDVKDIYILKRGKERREDHISFHELSKKLSASEFIELCKDKGLGVTVLQETIVVD